MIIPRFNATAYFSRPSSVASPRHIPMPPINTSSAVVIVLAAT